MAGGRRSIPTIHEVADRAGVSTATASRALSNYGRIADATRQRVLDAANEIGYRPNSLAKSMITGRTNTIGVVCADIHSPFFSGVVRGITDRAAAAGYSVLITNSDENTATEEAALEALLSRRVDGIIISPADVGAVAHLHRASQLGTPIVLVDRASSHFPSDAVLIDGPQATRQVVARLLASGHKRIGIVAELRAAGEADWMSALMNRDVVDVLALNPSSARLYGYIQAHRDAGVEVDPELVLRSGEYSAESAKAATLRALALDDPVSAIVAIDATMTLGAYHAIRETGRRVPEELSFVGFDDQDWTELVSPSISVISQPVYEMGSRAADLLVRRLDGDDSEPLVHTMQSSFVERQSIGLPAVP